VGDVARLLDGPAFALALGAGAFLAGGAAALGGEAGAALGAYDISRYRLENGKHELTGLANRAGGAFAGGAANSSSSSPPNLPDALIGGEEGGLADAAAGRLTGCRQCLSIGVHVLSLRQQQPRRAWLPELFLQPCT